MTRSTQLLGIRSKVVLTLLIACGMVACSKEPGPEAQMTQAPKAEASVGKTSEYEWFSEGTPAGNSTVVRTGDGKIVTESFVHWNNREYTVNSEVQLDANGLVVAQKITGISPFGAPIDEAFSYEDGVARWSTVGVRRTVSPTSTMPLPLPAVSSIEKTIASSSGPEIATGISADQGPARVTVVSSRST